MSDWEGCIIVTIGLPKANIAFQKCTRELHPRVYIYSNPIMGRYRGGIVRRREILSSMRCPNSKVFGRELRHLCRG